jgi:hypothetical protein
MTVRRVFLVCAVSLCVLGLAGSPASGRGSAAPDLGPYRGVGTWVDLYSPSFRADPDRLTSALAARGVDALFVETGNYKQRLDLVAPRRLGRLIEAAHGRGIAVVAWYLPDFVNVARDLRRARAAIRFRTDAGERFDSFALDIEASVVRNAAIRTRRLLALSATLRADVGDAFPLGAIIPSPVGMKLLPRYWPRFPYADLARTYDVVVPMAYYSYRARGRAAVARYVQTSIGIIRRASGDATVPVHVIGGLADRTTTGEVAAFAQAAATCGAFGLSLYDYDTTQRPMWPLLHRAPAPTTAGC